MTFRKLISTEAMLYRKGSKYRKPMENRYNNSGSGSSKESIKSILQYPIADLTNRGIRKEVTKFFDVRMALSENDATPKAIYFPFYNKQKKLSGWKRKDLTLSKNDDYYITTIGKVGVDCLMFGQKEAEDISRKHTKITIVEGEEDLLSSYQAMVDSVKGGKFEGLQPFVVSLACGTANAADNVIHNSDFILGFDQIILGLDNDKASDKERRKGILRGKEATEAIASVLLVDNIWIVEYPEGVKDPNDMLMEGKSKELASILSFPKNKFVADKVVVSSEFDFEELIEKRPDGVMIPAFPKLMDKIHGFRKKELSVICSLSGCVDVDTEFLTPKGWKSFGEYQEGDKVAQYHINGEISFVVPEAFIKLPCEEMTRVTNRSVDQVLSDEHNVVYYSNNKDKKLKTKMFSEVKEKHEKNSCGFAGLIPTTFKYSGDGIDFTEGELRLQVAVMADGRIVKGGKDNYTQMRFSKKRKYERLLALCRKYNLWYQDNGSKYCEKYKNKTEYEVIVWPKTNDKYFSSKFYNCTEEQLRIICDEIFHWDGTLEGTTYTSTNKEDMDFIQFAFAAIGRKASISIDSRTGKYNGGYCGTVYLNKGSGFSTMRKSHLCKTEFKPYKTRDGYKYCFTVETGMLVLRRNNKIFITGNSGKSTIVSEMAHSMGESGWRVGMIFLEEDKNETFQRLMARRLKVPHNKFKFNPQSCGTREELKEAYDWVADNDRFVFLSHFGSLKVDELLNKIKIMHLINKVDFIILDHLTMVVSGLDVTNERKELDLVLTELATYVKNNEIGILAVSHLNRDASDDLRGTSKVTEPIWIKVNKESMRGSSSLEAVSWMVFGIDVEIMPDRTRGRVRLTCLKNRPLGFLGEADTVKMNKETGLLEAADYDDI